MIAHPYVPRLTNSRLELAGRHLSVIEFSGKANFDLVDTWRNNLNCYDQIFVTPISIIGRPDNLLGPELTEFILAFIGVHELCPLDWSSSLRNSYAHYWAIDDVFHSYLAYVFSDHPDLLFLKSLL